MQVSTTNDVKIYNLSAGKSLPDWISERKRRLLVKKVKTYFFCESPPPPAPYQLKGLCHKINFTFEGL
jgi:hypothetical protein